MCNETVTDPQPIVNELKYGGSLTYREVIPADDSIAKRLGLCGQESGIPVEGAIIIKLLAVERTLKKRHVAIEKTIKLLRKENKELVAQNLYLRELGDKYLCGADDDEWYDATP